MLRRTCLAAGLFALASGCASASAPTLPMPIGQDLPVEIVMNQQELGVDVSQTAAQVGMQFGLVGAIVGASIQNEQVKKAEAAVVPLRNLLVEYAFNDRLMAALHAKLASDGISANPGFTVLKTPWDAVDAQNSQHVPLHALVLIPRYSLDSDFARLNVQVTAQVVDREIRDNGTIKTKFELMRTYAFHFPLVKEDGVDNLARWQAMGGGRIEGLLDEGIDQVVDTMVYDMSAKGRAEWSMDGDKIDVEIKGEKLHGVPVHQTPDWVWVRSGYVRAQSLQGIEPVSEHDAAPAVAASTPSPAAAVPVASAAPAATATPAAPGSTPANTSAPSPTTSPPAPAASAPAAVVAAPQVAPSPATAAVANPAPPAAVRAMSPGPAVAPAPAATPVAPAPATPDGH